MIPISFPCSKFSFMQYSLYGEKFNLKDNDRVLTNGASSSIA